MPANWSEKYLICALIYAGLTNALIRPVAASIFENGFVNALLDSFGVNAAVWFSIGLISINLNRCGEAVQRIQFGIVPLIVMIGLMVPSATVSWISVAVLAGWILQQSDDHTLRAAASILVVLALRDPLLSNLSQLFNTEILALDTWMVSVLVSLFDQAVYHNSNLIQDDKGVRLIILKGCSSLTNLSYAFLIWYSISKTYAPRLTVQGAWSLLLVITSIILFNVTRLALMSMNESNYALIHNATSHALQSVLMLVSVLFISFWGAQCFSLRRI